MLALVLKLHLETQHNYKYLQYNSTTLQCQPISLLPLQGLYRDSGRCGHILPFLQHHYHRSIESLSCGRHMNLKKMPAECLLCALLLSKLNMSELLNKLLSYKIRYKINVTFKIQLQI